MASEPHESYFEHWPALRLGRVQTSLLFRASIVGAMFLYLLFKDIHLHLWLDEINTLYMAQLGSLSQIIGATLNGADASPPLYNTIVHFLLRFTPSAPLAVRLPSTVGFCVMGLALLAFLHNRLPAAYALVAAALACQLSLTFASEGRAYGLVCGLAALSLMFWRWTVEGRRYRSLYLGLLALLSAAIAALHYYAIFFVICLFIAELVRWREKRQFEFAVSVALLAPATLVLLLHAPLIIAGQRFNEHFWSSAHLYQIITFYKMPTVGAIVFIGLLIAAFFSPADLRRPGFSFPLYELVAILVIAFAPVAIITLSAFTTHTFAPRYAIWAVVGIGPLAAVLLCFLGRSNAVPAILSLATLAAFVVVGEVSSIRGFSSLRFAQPFLNLLSRLPPDNEPIVVVDPKVFGELSYYAPREIRDRVVYADCPDLDLKYLGYNSATLVLEKLSSISPLKIESCRNILFYRRPFELVATNSDYFVWVLSAMGRVVVPTDISARYVFDVRAGS